MHEKYQRRRLRAERDFVHKRQTSPSIDPDDGVASDAGNGDSGGFSAPTTITVIETIAVTTSASSTQMTTLTSFWTMSSVIGTTTQTTTVSTPTSTSTSTSSTTILATSSSSTSTFVPVASVLPPSATPSTTSSPGHEGNSSEAQGSLATSSTSLSGGGVAGIVIACLILVAAVLIFFLRKRFIQRRRRATGAWTRRSGLFNPTSLGFGTSNEPKIEPFQSFSQGDSKSGPISNIMPPPIAMNSPTTPYVNSPVSLSNQYTSTGGDAPSTQFPLNLSPFLATVVCTFIITLPDELSIVIGEKMRVLAEYDDGWALCMRTNGEQGMVPLECLDQSRTSTNNILGLPVDSRGSRRISSLDTSRAGLKVARS